MNEVRIGDLVIRMLVSLAVVLGLILVAYIIVKRRRGGSSTGSSNRMASIMRAFGGGRTTRSSGTPRRASRPGASKRGLQTLGRIGLSRTSNVLAVQFAERVYLLGTSESDSPTVLADVSMDAWLESLESPEDRAGFALAANGLGSSVGGNVVSSVIGIPLETEGRPKLLDALREVTTRRG